MSKFWFGVLFGMLSHTLFVSSIASAQPFGPPVRFPALEWLLGKPVETATAQPTHVRPSEQRRIDSILNRWQQAGTNIKSFSCRYTR